MIDRIALGTKFPPFSIEVPEDLITELQEIFPSDESHRESTGWLPLTWPTVLTSRGTACLIPVWEELGVDPIRMRLVAEEFHYTRQPHPGEELFGRVRVADLDEIVSPERGIEQQVDLNVDFDDSTGQRVASYTCSYRLALAVPPGCNRP